MKIWLRLLLLVLLLAPLNTGFSQDKKSQPDKIFLLIGQSNMAGRAALEKGDDQPIDGVLLLTDKGQWEPASNPLNRYSNIHKGLAIQRFNPGDGFARMLRKAHPEATIGLVVNARGGTKIEEWTKGAPLYESTLKRIRSVPGLKFHGVLWHQGESNAKDEKYLDKLAKMVADLRSDLGQPELPFIAGQVYGKHLVNDLIAKLPSRVPHTGVASADDLKVFDKVHFDHRSQTILGQRYAEAYLKLVTKK